MPYIPTNTQRKLMFIPLVNAANYFIALHNCGKAENPGKMKLTAFTVVICILLPFTFLSNLLSSLFPSLEDIIFLCAIYFGPLIMSYGLIRIQEKALPA